MAYLRVMKKKTVLITGGSSNLGIEIAKQFKAAGYMVYSTSQSELNITDDKACQRFTQKIVRDQEKIDVLVNCAGVTPVGPLLEESADDFLKTLNINAVGAFRLIRESVPYMGKKSRGKIININSLNGLVPLPNYGIYSASKHALEAMSFALRQELKEKNICVTSILPGAILNEKKINLPQTHKPAREKFLILKYLMPFLTPEKVAESVLKVAEEKAPPARVVLGNDAKIITFLVKMLPFSLWDRLVYYVWSHK